ncbi:MAG: hypothetical protein GXO10_06400 [Crenarchaeota archaeon]|nr:hypothetical protein [Thermoproteota archaeon]
MTWEAVDICIATLLVLLYTITILVLPLTFNVKPRVLMFKVEPYVLDGALQDALLSRDCAYICDVLHGALPNAYFIVYRNSKIYCTCGIGNHYYSHSSFLFVRLFNNDTYTIEAYW